MSPGWLAPGSRRSTPGALLGRPTSTKAVPERPGPVLRSDLPVLGGVRLEGPRRDLLQPARDLRRARQVDRPRRRLANLGVVQRAGGQPARVQPGDLMRGLDDPLAGQVLVLARLVEDLLDDLRLGVPELDDRL